MSSVFHYGLSFAEYLFRRNLKHLIVHVTNHCNFRCSHCFIDFSKKKDLGIETYQALARQVPPLFWLDIGGGEPFLRKDLADIVTAFDTRVVTIPSNGSLPDLMMDQIARIRRTSTANLVIGLSLDGLKETHDSTRNAPGNWSQVWSTFEQLRRVDGLSVKINTVLTRENRDEILPLMEEVRRRGPDFHSVILLRGSPADASVALPPIEDLQRLAPQIFAILETYDYGRNLFAAHVLRNYHRYLWNVSLRTLKEQTQVIPCQAGKAHMVVMGDGSVSSCELLPAVGNIRDQSLDDIRSGTAFREQVRAIERKACHCTHNCALFDSILFNPASLPHLLRSRIE